MGGRKEKILEMAKGYRGRAKNCITVARPRVEKALQYAYRDRRVKRREFRSLWISRINAGAREHGYTYAQFTHQQNQAGVVLNRKVLADLAAYEPYSFKAVVDVARACERQSEENRAGGLAIAADEEDELSLELLTKLDSITLQPSTSTKSTSTVD